jgi:hypothetical protein
MKRTTRMGRTRQRNRRQRKTRKKENCSPPPPFAVLGLAAAALGLVSQEIHLPYQP